MIYLLVEDSKGYDDCDRPLFAHADKEVVEMVQRKLEKQHERLHSIAMSLSKELDELYEANPLPSPKLETQTMREYEEAMARNREKVHKWSDDIIDRYAQAYRLSAQERENIFHHTDEITFSIDEIEDDVARLYSKMF